MATVSATVLAAYAQDLVCDGGDNTNLSQFATTLLEDELPMLPNGWRSQPLLQAVTAGTATYALSSGVRKLLAMYYGGRELSHERWDSLQVERDWKDTTGAPRAWTMMREQDRTYRLIPTPDRTSTSASGLSTETDRLILITMFAESTIPLYLRLPAALWILSQEYNRESDHRDTTFAKLCQAMAERFFKMVDGVAA